MSRLKNLHDKKEILTQQWSIIKSSTYIMVKLIQMIKDVLETIKQCCGCVIITKEGLRLCQLTSSLLSETQLLSPVLSCLGCHRTYASLCLQRWKKKKRESLLRGKKAEKDENHVDKGEKKRTEKKRNYRQYQQEIMKEGGRYWRRQIRRKDKEGCN